MDEQVPQDVKSERLQRLQALIKAGWRRFNAGFAGRIVEVLLEKSGRHPGQLTGKSPYLQTVQLMAPRSLIGSLTPVRVKEVGSNTLFGDIVENTMAPDFTAAGA
jgi:tRNA-2-methylthio-N6-dimethylallyladenosine synthase